MICPRCQSQVASGDRFCHACGAALPTPCAACGQLNPSAAPFCGTCGAALDAKMSASSIVGQSSAQGLAERRLLTVMFCDLVGSTTLARQVDPEDLRAVIGAFHRCIGDVIARFGGHVARYMGDGALIYFGYPQAHEDDPERAVRAALAAVAAIAQLRPLNDYSPQIRIGIATGVVVVGDIGSVGMDVAGETANLAARLQSAARPNTVLVAASTRRLLGELFECRPVRNLHLKGFSPTLTAHQVLRPSGIESRFEALRTAERVPMVDRSAECGTLVRLWGRACEGQGQMVLLSGEPGIGKSRLISEALGRIGEPDIRQLRFFCSPFHIDSALYPIARQIEIAARLQREDSTRAKLDKLARALGGGRKDAGRVGLVAELLGIDDREGPPAAGAMTPAQRKHRTLAALLHYLLDAAAHTPTVLVFEDAHWADASTREFIDMVAERIQRLPVLLLVSFRPEIMPAWSALPHATTMVLPRLEPPDRLSLVQNVARNKLLPPQVLDQLLRRTDGIPLFMEEMTKAVLESGYIREEPSRYVLAGPMQQLAIPTSLNASLISRIAKLSVAPREVAQLGAAIGREFSYPLLAAIAGVPDEQLRLALEQLIETGLVLADGTPPYATYSFKHALVRDVIYETLLRDQRQELHARIGGLLEERFPETCDTEADLLAHHFAQAGAFAKALDYWLKAGRRASGRSAMAEAAALLRRGLDLLPHIGDTRERSHRELELLLPLGNALIARDGYTAPETGRVYERARVLCETLGDTEHLVRVANGLWSFHLMRADIRGALKTGQELLRKRRVEPALRLSGHRLLGGTLLQVGRLEEARAHLERGRRILMRGPGPRDHLVGGNDARVGIPAYQSIVMALLGAYEQAHEQAALALAEAKRKYRPHRYAFALGVAGCWFHVVMNEDAPELYEAFAAVCEEHQFPFWSSIAEVWRGLNLAKAGQVREGIAIVRDAVQRRRTMGAVWGMEFFLGTAASYAGGDDGLALVEEALRHADRTGINWFEPELHRIRARMLEQQCDLDAADACYRRALRQARAQKSRHWEIRSAVNLAQLRRIQGRPTAARRLLLPFCGGRAERIVTADLRAAADLLASLPAAVANTASAPRSRTRSSRRQPSRM